MDIKINKDTTDLLSMVSSIAGEEPELLTARENEIYLKVSETGFKDISPSLAERKFSLIGLFCAEAFEKKEGFTLVLCFQTGRPGTCPCTCPGGSERKKGYLSCRNIPISLLV